MANDKKIPTKNLTNLKWPLSNTDRGMVDPSIFNKNGAEKWKNELNKTRPLSLDAKKVNADLEKSGKNSKVTLDSVPSNKQNSAAQQNSNKCSSFCRVKGFNILPLRYSVTLDRKNPLPANLGKNVKNIQLSNFGYTVTMVNTGYVYCLTKRVKSGFKGNWSGYKVTPKGYLSYFVVDKNKIAPVDVDEFACQSSTHQFAGSVITIEEKPNDPATEAYIIYTHTSMSDSKRAEYEKNADAFVAEGKWQKVKIGGGAFQEHCFGEAQINSAIYNLKSFGDNRIKIMKEKFTAHPKAFVCLGLYDAIGITKELNESRNAQFSSLMKFLSQGNNQHKFESSQTVDSLKTIIENKLIRQNLAASATVNEQTVKMIYAKDKIPKFSSNIDQREYQKRVNEIWQKASDVEKKRAIEEYHKKYDVNKTKERIINASKEKTNTEWNDKYNDRFNWVTKKNFDNIVKNHIDKCKASSASYAKDHLLWIQSKQLLNALSVYDQMVVSPHGAEFYTHVMNIMNGMTGTDEGQNLMEKWLLQAKVTNDNLYLRAVLYNQKELLTKFESAAKSTDTLDWDQSQSTIKDFIGAVFATDQAWEKWLADNGGKLEKQGWMTKGVMFISAITRITVKWSLKYNANDAISKGLSRISLIAYAHGGVLKDKVPKYSLLHNADLRMAKQGNSLSATQIQANWKNLQSNATAKKIKEILNSSSTATSLRISGVVALLELINFGSKGGKLLNDPNWENSTGAIAGMFSLTAATLDIASNGMEALSFAQKAEKIKIYGATFAVAASVFSVISDSIALTKEKNGFIFALLMLKLGFSFAMISVGLGVVAQLPVLKSRMIELGAKYIFLEKLVQMQVMRAAAFFNWIGLTLTILIIILQKLVLPNDLEVWCKKSIFGTAENSDKYSTLAIEEKAFNEAIQSI